MKSIVPIIYNELNKPVERATCRLNIGVNAWITGLTNSDGVCDDLVVDDTLQNTQFEVYACEYESFGQSINLGTDGNKQIRVGLAADPNRPQDIILPALKLIKPNQLPQIIVRNNRYFGLDNGEYWTAIECTDFNLFNKYQMGEDITPILEQRQEIGFNLLRVWTLFDVEDIGTLTECNYSLIPSFVALCASYELYVEFTAYVQPELQFKMHWTNLINAALLCTTKPLLELMNEQDQHPIDLSPYSQAPAPLLSAHGSNGSDRIPVRPAWSYETFHTNDAFEWQRKVGHNAMIMTVGETKPDGTVIVIPSNVPTLSNENTRYDHDPSYIHSFDAAVGSILCAGSCCHTPSGKISALLTGNELEWAKQWVMGAKSMDLACQDGNYRHATELEEPGDLRVYQQGDCIIIIRV